MCLVVTLFLLAVFFIFLDADFVAALQVVVYAGAIMVVFLFVIMLLNLRDDPHERSRPSWRFVTLGGASAVRARRPLLAHEGRHAAAWAGMQTATPAGFGSIEAVGLRLYTQYLLQFEITGLLMLAGVIGAVVLAKRRVG